MRNCRTSTRLLGVPYQNDLLCNNTGLLQIFAAEVPGEASEEDDEDIYEQRTSSQVNNTASIYRNNLLQRKLSK